MARLWTASQEDAINLRGQLLVVSAAAGSGKTSVLTERIVRMLTDPEHPAELSRMLIVTFTRAAAAELKSRIGRALDEALAADPENERLSRQILSLGSAHISTIDSFFGEEVRAGFAELGISASFRIADEGELSELAIAVMEDSLSALYEEYTAHRTSSPDAPFARLSGNAFAAVMDHLLSNRRNDGLAEQLWCFYRRFSCYPEGIRFLLTNAQDLNQAAQESFFASQVGATVRQRVLTVCADYLRGLDTVQKDLLEADLLPKYAGCLQADTELCQALYTACNTKSYQDAYATVRNYAPTRLPSVRGEKPPAIDYYKALRADLKETVKSLCTNLFAWTEKEICGQLQQHAEECEMLYKLLARFEEGFNEEKRLRGILSFDDMPALLLRLLKQPDGSPTAYATELSSRFDAVLIDEYQDVNPIQDHLFSAIGGDRRFMVGDIKQSIYGFRGGEPSIFAAYRKALPLYQRDQSTAGNGACVFMSENFRCSQPIVDYANRVCAFLFSACEESVGYRPQDDLVCKKHSPEGTCVPVRTLLFDPYPDAVKKHAAQNGETLPSREALWISAEIAHLLHNGHLEDGSPIRPRDVAILTRTAAPMQELSERLRAWGIPVVTPSGEDLLTSPLTSELLDLLKAIDNPYRDLPLSEYLLTPSGGFSLEELGDIRATVPEPSTLFEALCTVADTAAHPCREKAKAFVAWLEGWRSLSAVQSADRLLHLLLVDPRLSAYAATPEARALYEQARVYQSTSWCGLYGFLDRIQHLAEQDGLPAGGFQQATDAVTLMTVHKSKGLEFPVVFLAGCGTRFSNKTFSQPLLLHPSVGIASHLFCRESGANEGSILLSAVTAALRDDEREEEIRGLYVALTRARERLYVTGSISKGSADQLRAKATVIRRNSRTHILGASSRLHWIVAALENEASDKDTLGVEIVPADAVLQAPPTQPQATDCVHTAPQEEARSGTALPGQASTPEKERIAYPFRCLNEIPTKAAASKLTPDLLDRLLLGGSDIEESRALAAAIDLMRSEPADFDDVLNAHKKAAPTEIGTAMHTFLEVCDFEALWQNGANAELERLLSDGILSPKVAALLDPAQLELFRNSSLLQEIRCAAEVLREQRFGINLPITLLTEHPERFAGMERETVFVQGSIDLCLRMPDGSVYLYDYKTDRLSPAELADPKRLAADYAERYGNQLACYAKAVRGLFGCDPKQICIYSFPTGAAIPIRVDTRRFG